MDIVGLISHDAGGAEIAGRVNANVRIALCGVVTSSLNASQYTDTDITIYWEELNGVIDLNTSYPEKLATPPTKRNLVLKKNTLSPGQQYNFKMAS